MSSSLRIVVTGLIAQYPLGGVAWDYLQYVLGLRELGHDVHYVEDTGQWPYNPAEGGTGTSAEYNVAYLGRLMESFDLGDRWAYRFPRRSRWYGMGDARRKEILDTADLLINVSGTLARPERYRSARRLAYIDSDPVFTQLKLARGQTDFRALVDVHDVHFSFGEALADPVPATDVDWRPTRQPIVLSRWRPGRGARDVYTTVMNWTSHNSVEYGGQSYGQKDVEFERFLDLPRRVDPVTLELAVAEGKNRRTPYERLRHEGWHVVDPAEVCPDARRYRDYIETSRAEWSVAKNGYVRGRPGWFSCRSACYLAAGKPVVVQDTGFGDVLPVGEGLLSFTDPEDAERAIREVEADYERHADAARAIAEEHFDARRVLGRLVEEAMAA